MSIGFGIFLGLFFCGLIYLYTQTKDRWNWAKRCKSVFVVLGVLISLGLISIGGIFLYDYYQGIPKVITEFKGVKLGESLSDVTFKLGNPEKVKNEWYGYSSPDRGVKIQDGKVSFITYFCKNSDYTKLNGIKCNSSGDTIFKRFGKDVRVLCDMGKERDDKLIRAYDVMKYGTRYYLYTNLVYRMGITSPETLKSSIGTRWDHCQ